MRKSQEDAYLQGFIDKCAENGVDPVKLAASSPTPKPDAILNSVAPPGSAGSVMKNDQLLQPGKMPRKDYAGALARGQKK